MKDIKAIFELSSWLTRSQRLILMMSLCVRLLLVSLDVFGLALLGVSVALVSATSVDKTSLTGRFLDLMTTWGLPNTFVVFAFGSVVFFILKAALAVALNRKVLNSVAKIEAGKAFDLFQLVNRSTLTALSRFSTREIRYALLESIEMAIGKFLMSVSVLFGEAVLIVFICIFLLITDWKMFIWVAGYFAAVGWIMHVTVSKKNKDTAEIMQVSALSATGTILSALENHRQVFLRKDSHLFEENFRRARTDLSVGNATLSNLSVLPRYITEVALILGFALLVLQKTIWPSSGAGTVVMAIFVAGSFRIVASLLPLQGSLALLKQVLAIGTLSLEVQNHLASFEADREPEEKPRAGFEVPPSIVFKNVSFGYQGNLSSRVLDEASVIIEPGQSVAITGKSGEGKSTFADLLMGLLEPTAGSITIGGLAPLEYLRANPAGLGYMPQTSTLIDGTLAENVAFQNAGSGIDFERVSTFLRKVGLGDLEESLPEGLNSKVGELRTLSGGQIQRVGLARILYQAPPIIVLDESTSALDSESESLVLETLANLKGESTIIVISHSIKTVNMCDRKLLINSKVIKEIV